MSVRYLGFFLRHLILVSHVSHFHVHPCATHVSALPGPDLPRENVGDDQDMHMTDGTFGASPLPKLRNHNDVPPWLTSKIVYFHGVAEDAAWQDLITHLVEFEKSGPPNGVSFILLSLIVNLV